MKNFSTRLGALAVGLVVAAMSMLLSSCALVTELDTPTTPCTSRSDCPQGQACSAEGYCYVSLDAVMDFPNLPDTTVEVDTHTVDGGPDGLPDVPDTLQPDTSPDAADTDANDTVETCDQADCADGDACCLCDGAICDQASVCCSDGAGARICVDPLADDANCGGCGVTCEGDETCGGGQCLCPSAEGGPTACNKTAGEACCAGQGCLDLSASTAHCGACTTTCNPGELCTSGACVCGAGAACEAGAVCCDGACCGNSELCCEGLCKPLDDPTCDCGTAPPCLANELCCDGATGRACVNPAINAANCGGCGLACSDNQVCSGTTCICEGDFEDCDTDPSNGCEASIKTDVAHCGSCTTACDPGEACVAGICQCPDGEPLGADTNCSFCGNACAAGQTCCNDTCVNFSVDEANCGACGNPCAAGDLCCAGACTQPDSDDANCSFCGNACSPGSSCCGGLCQNLSSDTNHCGACGNPCAANEVCCGGACVDPTLNANHCGFCNNACAAGSSCCGGFCRNLAGNLNHCGACNRVCDNTNGTPGCTGGDCAITCRFGFANCDMDASDGCEVDVRSDPTNCGQCGVFCEGTNGSGSCNNGTCLITCDPGFGNCDGDPNNGCETPTGSDPTHCGGCAVTCGSSNATATCTAGSCGLSCATDYDDCNGVNADGCEAHLPSSVLHCGACATSCPNNNGAATCVAGGCTIACNAGFRDCDAVPANGCETNLSLDASNCGACSNICSSNHGAPSCVGGACAIACDSGYDDCNGDPSDGCETYTDGDLTHCGACGALCDDTNNTPSCATGTCTLACMAGFKDCNSAPSDGCEADIDSDTTHCGTCAIQCGVGEVCQNGVCEVPNCPVGETRCAALCYDLTSEATRCGGCNSDCTAHPQVSSASCLSSACDYTCNAGFDDCTAAAGCETNLATNVAHCGGCNSACDGSNGTPSCAAGTCAIACDAGWGNCNASAADGCEVETASSPANCGGCGNVCSSNNGTAGCSFGTCTIACSAGFEDCNGNVSDGCETNTSNNVAACGGCGVSCVANHGTPSCQSGACQIACDPGYADCNGDPADGCETNTASNATHCGTCGNACASTNGTATCAAGSCDITCDFGYDDCNANPSDGCEVYLNASIANCGVCGNQCSAVNGTPTCDGSCSIACNSGYVDCDGDLATGCEAQTATDKANCGSCGNACNDNNGTATCSSGSCGIQCDPGWGNCNGLLSDGCETSLSTSSNCAGCGVSCSGQTPVCCSSGCTKLSNDGANCGACGNVCGTQHASSSCKSGVCELLCGSGWGDCDGIDATGCETNTNTTLAHCGACGWNCDTPHAANTCSSGSCFFTCDAGWGNCDGLTSNGCETDLNNSDDHCTACGVSCGDGEACSGGLCVCAPDYDDCDANPANGCEAPLLADVDNCGACGVPCGSGQACVNGSCMATWNCGTTQCPATSASACLVTGSTCVYMANPQSMARSQALGECSALGAGWGLCTSNEMCLVSVNNYLDTTPCSCTGGPTQCNCANSNVYMHVGDSNPYAWWTRGLPSCGGATCGPSASETCGAALCCHF